MTHARHLSAELPSWRKTKSNRLKDILTEFMSGTPDAKILITNTNILGSPGFRATVSANGTTVSGRATDLKQAVFIGIIDWVLEDRRGCSCSGK